MHASALRAPGIKEVGLNQEEEASTFGSTSAISAERFESTELAFIYYKKKFSIQSMLFYNTTSNALDGATVLDENVFINSSSVITAKGFEVELAYKAMKNLDININYSYAVADDENNVKVQDVPNQTANLILNYLIQGDTPLNNNIPLQGRSFLATLGLTF